METTIEVKKPATRLYTSVKMAAHELRTKILPAWERANPWAVLSNKTVISLMLVTPAKDDEPGSFAQIDIGRGETPRFTSSNTTVEGAGVDDLRDLIVVVEHPTVRKNFTGEHTVDQLLFSVEAYRVKTPNQPKPSKKKVKGKSTGIVPKQMDLYEYVEELDKRVTESIRSLLEKQDKAMKEKIEEVNSKIEEVKEVVDEIQEDIKETKQGFEKLRSMFGKWEEFFKSSSKNETEDDSENDVVGASAN